MCMTQCKEQGMQLNMSLSIVCVGLQCECGAANSGSCTHPAPIISLSIM